MFRYCFSNVCNNTERKSQKVAALLIPATLTAVVVGITEPLEFTFLFIAPYLFVLHAVLAASMDTLMYAFGVVGNMGGGLLDFISTNWLPLGKEHWGTYVAQVIIGLIFVAIYFFLFRFLILKFDIPLPGRKKTEEEVKLFSKQDYKNKKVKIQHQNLSLQVMNMKIKLYII